MTMETAYLCLGSNVGDRAGTLGLAIGVLARAGLTIRARSSLYETPPWGPIPQGPYLNQVVEVESPVNARSLLFLGLLVELMLGRNRAREVRFGPRRIDIDILLFGQQAIAEPDLEIPHPRMLERAFALVPLVEIAPELIIQGTRAADALARLDATDIRAVAG
ncbi:MULTISPECIES: 2-amino-4-hydroxy-6-hydroxymethyldihydropteridine diphosphokinase [unclassified Xanthobacter]|uniref:2-amino-4-hydroxy-6- hydroxymethyldihydropteridine diphosphokinase n=1 Tax=unclassified Xanthobacter TaxID=2623496 RepID=UPI001F1FC5B6|nr:MULTISPECIES: 2-amino-4-hydroxy-6-hydroxymethyldihydropteridine diphosphokinase [unclassified Xanthobacter]